MYTPINIPQLSRKEVFEVAVSDEGFTVTCNVPGAPENPLGETLVFLIDADTPKGAAEQLRVLLNDILKAGFEQGREHVREALGIKK